MSNEARTEARTEAPFYGGSYDECLKKRKSNNECVHHLIAKAALSKWYPFTRKDDPYWDMLLADPWQHWAPSITMTKDDHKQTYSYYEDGMSLDRRQLSQWYINRQATDLIYSGDFLGALNREKKKLKSLFGEKYQEACDQAIAYVQDVLKVRQTPDYKLHFGHADHVYDYYRIPTRPRKVP